MKKLLVSLLASMLLLLPVSASAATRRSTNVTPQKGFGIAGESLLWDENIDATLADMKSMGINWARVDINWAYLQPKRNTFRWQRFDNLVNRANAHGVKLLFILDYSAPWAYAPGCYNNEFCRPDANKFAAYAKAVVQRYAPRGVHAYEVWNEPNLDTFWYPRPNATHYTNLLKAAYPSIKQADPNSVVIAGGLAPIATYDVSNSIAAVNFLKSIYSNGGKNYFDAVGYHPYSYPARPMDFQEWNGFSILDETQPSVRSVMTQNGDSNKQIWLTEFGAPTNGPGGITTCENYTWEDSPDHVDECLQANIFTEGITLAKQKPYVGPMFLYTYKDPGYTIDNKENFFGLLRFDGSRKPAYEAVKNAIAN